MAGADSSTLVLNDDNRGPNVEALCWTEAGIAILVVGLRLVSRFRNNSLGWDDWWMLVALLLFIVLAAVDTWYSRLGGFRHLAWVAEHGDMTKVLHTNYIMQSITIFSFAPPKTSIGMLVLRIMQSIRGPKATALRRLIYTSLIVLWVSTILDVLFTFIQCNPSSILWNPNDTALAASGHCWKPDIQANFAIYLSSVNIACDVILAFVPVGVVYRLNIDRKKKVALSILMGYGVIAAVFGIVKTNFLRSLTARSDLTWETYNLVVWSVSESWVIIVCGSIPPVYLLFMQAVQKQKWRRGEQQAAMLGGRGSNAFKAWAYSVDPGPNGMHHNGSMEDQRYPSSASNDGGNSGIMPLRAALGRPGGHRKADSSIHEMAGHHTPSDEGIVVSTHISMTHSSKQNDELNWR